MRKSIFVQERMDINTSENLNGEKAGGNQTENEQALEMLGFGEIELLVQFTRGSNHTFLARVTLEGKSLEAVYKPQRGEQPLWDFPSETLARREVAAYLVSEALGWELVPPTVYRQDGPYGQGSLQLRVNHNPQSHYFTFDRVTRQRLRPAAVFDLIVNNADRKGGHILLGEKGKIWLIDHGTCFHAEPKLRTVVWDFVGETIPAELLASVQGTQEQVAENRNLRNELENYLSWEELRALDERLGALLAAPRFPEVSSEKRVTPWPLV